MSKPPSFEIFFCSLILKPDQGPFATSSRQRAFYRPLPDSEEDSVPSRMMESKYKTPPRVSRKEPALRRKGGLSMVTGPERLNQKENFKPRRADQGANRVSHLLNPAFVSPA